MGSEIKHKTLPVHKRIVFLLVLPVIIVGFLVSGVLIGLLSPPMESFLIGHFGANLRLASKLGVRICETHFNRLLDMRLEDDPEMNTAFKMEALGEIQSIGSQVPNVSIMVLEDGQHIKTISVDFPQNIWVLPAYNKKDDAIQDMMLGEAAIKAHIQYFPFWDWHIISFVNEKDYLAPISTARQIVYLSTLGVLIVVLITLLLVFQHSVMKPLNLLIVATKDVTKGKLLPVYPVRDNEIGQLMTFFNNMVESLKWKTEEVGGLIDQLKESEARYRSLVELSPEAVFVHQDGIIKYINRSGANIFGAGIQKELMGRKLMELIHPDFHEEINAQIQKVYTEHQTLMPHELRYVTMDNKVIDVEATGTYIEYSGKPAMLSVIRDITERKQAEKAIRESEDKLARSKKMESLGLLAGGVAHDLNNVLSGIVSYPELILMDLPIDSKLRKPIETIQDSGHRATAIVQDLLTMARGVATSNEVLNLNDLVRDYLNSPEFEMLGQFHTSVTIKTNLDSDLFFVKGSQVHIRKAIMNLISNAAEAIEISGNVIISTMNRYIDRPLKGYDDVKTGEYVILSVSDDGPGISLNDLKRIFEPFYTKKVMGRSGTGLGLAVVWNVVQDHGGYIDVTSNENDTRFELYFPITRDEIAVKGSSIPIQDYMGNGEDVLVVDDVASQREISCRMLEKLGYKTNAVSSGEEAIEYLKSSAPDLILLDMIMDPGMNGRETYEKIIKIHPNQRTVIVSGFAESDEVKEAQKLGAGRYIKKPISLGTLGVAVKEALGK